MIVPSSNICNDVDNTYFIPNQDSDSLSGYCLCATDSGLLQYDEENSKNNKCSLDIVFNGIPWGEYTSNSYLLQGNFKYGKECMDGYTEEKIEGVNEYVKCISKQCPTGWTNVGGSNCEIKIGDEIKRIDIKTLGYINVFNEDKDSNDSNEVKLDTIKLEDDSEDIVDDDKDTEEVKKDIKPKIIFMLKVIGGVLLFLLIIFIIYKIIKRVRNYTSSSKPVVRETQTDNRPIRESNVIEQTRPYTDNYIKYSKPELNDVQQYKIEQNN